MKREFGVGSHNIVLLVCCALVPVSVSAVPKTLNGVVAFEAPVKSASDRVLAVGSESCSVACAYQTYSIIGKPTFQALKTPGATFGAGSQLMAAAIAKPNGWAWAVGSSLNAHTSSTHTLIVLWNGEFWKTIPSPNYVPPGASPSDIDNVLYGVDASGFDNAWAVGTSAGAFDTPAVPVLLHWNGVLWAPASSPPNEGPFASNNVLNAVTVHSSTDAWAVGWHQDNPVAQRTLIYHWDGGAWSVKQSVDPGATANILNGVSSSSDGKDVWAVGTVSGAVGQLAATSTLIERARDGVWVKESSPNLFNLSGTDNGLNAVSVINKADVWAVGCAYSKSRQPTALILYWDGSHWTQSTTVKGCLRAVKALSDADVWATGESSAGTSLVLHRTVQGWQVVPSP